MPSAVQSASSGSALPGTESDWCAFVDVYGRVVLEWMRARPFAVEEAQWVAREMLLAIRKQFHSRNVGDVQDFRGWLRRAAHRAWCKLMERRMESDESQQSPRLLRTLVSVDEHDDFLDALDREFLDQERRDALAHALAAVDPPDWESFFLLAIEQMSPEEIGRELGRSAMCVKAGAFRVNQFLNQEFQLRSKHAGSGGFEILR
jgi:RNA polymerase sigma factor (sigma-70 family)